MAHQDRHLGLDRIPRWRPGLYPEGLQPADFLSFYATRFDTVELNSTGYRLPSADQFRRWAERCRTGSSSRPSSTNALHRVTTFLERVTRWVTASDHPRPRTRGRATTGRSRFVLGSVPEQVPAGLGLPRRVVGRRRRRRRGGTTRRRKLGLRVPTAARAAVLLRRAALGGSDDPLPRCTPTSAMRISLDRSCYCGSSAQLSAVEPRGRRVAALSLKLVASPGSLVRDRPYTR